MPDHNYFANLIWSIADLLRGPYRPPQYERVMLPMTVLRRFDCVLARTKSKVLAEQRRWGQRLVGQALDARLNVAAAQSFHNHSDLDFQKLRGDPYHIDRHLGSYIRGFSANVRRIFEYFEFEPEIEKMHEANILYLVVSRFSDMDLHPKQVPNEQMGLIFENIIRRFNELANETAGDHFTPREVIRLMVSILFIEDDKLLATPGAVRTLLDPACGTGGMLAEAQNYLRQHHAAARLFVFGQDYNKRAFATAASDMLMKQVDHNGGSGNIRFGDSFTEDRFEGKTFDYFITNPPFGVDWKKQKNEIREEHQRRGFMGRFGAGLPRVNDGSLLFLQHMIAKFEPVRPIEHKYGSRLAIVLSGSPLFTGRAGSGESKIRQWIIENDWLEAIIALPRADVLQHRHRHLRLDRHQPQREAAEGQDPTPRRARCMGRPGEARRAGAASATNAAISPRGRSPRSSSSTAASRTETTRRSSTTPISATPALPSSARYACATR